MDSQAFLAFHRVAYLATASAAGEPHVVPVVYAYDGTYIYIALDEKPKRVAAMQLKRVRNIEHNPHVSLLVDDYDEDWTELAWVRVDGTAKILRRGQSHDKAIRLLREKYPQYQTMQLEGRPLIEIKVERIVHWEAKKCYET